MGKLVDEQGLGVNFPQTFDKLGQSRQILGHDEQLVQARAVLIGDSDCLEAYDTGFASKKVLIALIGQIGRIAISISISAFHCLAEESVQACTSTDLDR